MTSSILGEISRMLPTESAPPSVRSHKPRCGLVVFKILMGLDLRVVKDIVEAVTDMPNLLVEDSNPRQDALTIDHASYPTPLSTSAAKATR